MVISVWSELRGKGGIRLQAAPPYAKAARRSTVVQRAFRAPIYVRVATTGDCAALDRRGCWATVKARMMRDLGDAIATLPGSRWRLYALAASQHAV
jgi:hypothetical protein